MFVVSHHLLKLFKANVTITIRIHRFDHTVTFLNGALHSEAVQNKVKLRGRDEAVLILIIEIKRIPWLRRVTVGAAEGGELGEIDEAVTIGVEIFHDTLNIRGGYAGSEGAEGGVELRDGDLAVAVGVETVEDSLEFLGVHVFEVERLVFRVWD
ncbi:hypothetical protein Lal_00026737 [Lupinus albus]|nr:hypothetical protein Lal_00026737 [Lupinus albus]